MVEVTQYRRLNPAASAVAAGCTELIFVLFIGLPMVGMHMMGRMMGLYAFGVLWWLGGAVLAAVGGAVFASIYNALNRS